MSVYILISGLCDIIIFHGRRDFADTIELNILDYPRELVQFHCK